MNAVLCMSLPSPNRRFLALDAFGKVVIKKLTVSNVGFSRCQLSMVLLKGDVIIECLNSSPNAVDSLGMTTYLGKVHGVWHIQFGGVCDVVADSFGPWRSRAFHIRRV